MRLVFRILVLTVCWSLFSGLSAYSQSNFRIFPYLQATDQNLVQLRWFSGQAHASKVVVRDSKGVQVASADVAGVEAKELYYTHAEKSQTITGLAGQSWIGAELYFRYDFTFRVPFGEEISYEVTLGEQKYHGKFKSAPDPKAWESIRFVALSDSETEPRGRVTHRAWYPGQPLVRFYPVPTAWKQKFGSTTEQGIELPNYVLTETEGYAANLEIINARKPDLMLMPGDLVQGGGYMPAWDEFWRHNAGEFDSGLSGYPIVAALGNWESYGGVNNGYGTNELGVFNPIVGRSRFHAFFDIPTTDPLQKHRQSYYRTDYGPLTILTLDSSNGTPDAKTSDTPAEQKLKGKAYTGPGTDTQENYTQAQYDAAGGSDLSGFGPGTPQYAWLEVNLKQASEAGRLIFVQFHHIPFSSGEHGVPMNHELATGQGGTPMRVLHPLFEKYGVIAVLAGHDELFERSFVDLDGDGKGVQYYDVGVAGDGMRGVKRDWDNNPLATLDYNEFSQWTADQKSVEKWDTSGANPVLVDGGKHYGHLEVNLKRVKDGNKTFAQIDFEPVYAFPVLDQNYNLQRVERRVYDDKLRILVELEEQVVSPDFLSEISLELDENGKASTALKDYLKNEVQADWTASFSRRTEYSCADLEGTENELKISDSKGNSWTKVVLVKVKDTTAPKINLKTHNLQFDLAKGFLEIKAEDFVSSVTDNCGVKTLAINKTRISCSEYHLPMEVVIEAIDHSGNQSREVLVLSLPSIESQKISISPESGSQYTVGQKAEIRLGSEFEFTLEGWYRNGQRLDIEKGNAILTGEPGTYWARLYPKGSDCAVESRKTEIRFADVPWKIKESVELVLGAEGKAELRPQDVLVTWPLADTSLEVTLGQTLFSCENLGESQVTVWIKKPGGDTWELKVPVLVKDETKPVLVPKNISLELDVMKGVAEISPQMLLSESGDNCGIKSLTISKNRFVCEDASKEFSVTIRAEDTSGNVTEAVAQVSVVRSEPEKVAISGPQLFCQGEKAVLALSSSKAFEVVRWRRNGVEVPGQTGKALEVSEAGSYHAVIRYVGGCLSETAAFEVQVAPKPVGEIVVDGNVLRAPEGSFSYQWYRNGEKISGATSRTFTANESGDYSVELRNEAGCAAMLKAFTLTISGLIGKPVSQALELKLYPNPASDRVLVELPDGALAGGPQIQLFSTEGKEVTGSVAIAVLDDSKLEISLNRMAKGTYLIWIVGEGQKTYFGKLMILN
ncbi:metallophosphoesterase [Algoriphagus sp. H41]|uniref:Metallophosphoesterase n=1 Tax=Algoriphagus oliviformis TaxID=2811231 RepID=A0ABS3C4N4_9BACT|nr:T9SS type A sorting domain-containing protein [Algoriphagus oliviformis]MBN7811938.1 metallophosphoesterase [Algoriphagus oliviformis]